MSDNKCKPKAFSVYCDTFEHIKLLDMQERGELLTALYEYALLDKQTDFENGKLQIAFSFMRAQMDRDFAKYEAACERNRIIAKSRKERAQRNQSLPVETSGNQYKYKDKDKNKEKYKDKKEHTLSAPADECAHFDYQSVLDSFNSICVSLPKALKLTDQRRKAIKKTQSRLDDLSFEDYFTMVEKSDFLTGRGGNDWQATFDWIMKPPNLIKVIEGSYSNRTAAKTTEQPREYEKEVF